jgi:prevent-host-death family protein
MDVNVSDAKGQLTELVRRAEAGEEIVLTRFGRPVARLVPVTVSKTPAEKRKILAAIRASALAKAGPDPDPARSHDFLYDEAGLPR